MHLRTDLRLLPCCLKGFSNINLVRLSVERILDLQSTEKTCGCFNAATLLWSGSSLMGSGSNPTVSETGFYRILTGHHCRLADSQTGHAEPDELPFGIRSVSQPRQTVLVGREIGRPENKNQRFEYRDSQVS